MATLTHPARSQTGHLITPRRSHGTPGKAEFIIASVVTILIVALRWFYAQYQSWGSDEPQHMHVVWAWANGYIPYRDIFDNHTPLFHFLCSPFFRWFGERPDIITPMRLLLVPLFGLSLWCVYRLGSRLISQRVGLWAAILTAFHPLYFFKMAEFRTDVLWATLWLVTLVILTDGPLTRRRLFWSGLLLGATFSASMKTLLLLVTLLSAGWLTLAISRWANEKAAAKRPVRAWALDSGAAIAGLLIVPAFFLGYFAWHGALDTLYYCVIKHSTIPGAAKSSHILKRLTEPEIFLALLLTPVVAAGIALFSKERERLNQRLFLFLTMGLFFPFLKALWPTVTPQDYLPWYPLIILLLVPVGFWVAERSGRPYALPVLLALVMAAEFGLFIKEKSPFNQKRSRHIDDIAQIMHLTRPNEFVMDAKGDLIYRPRAYYYVLETFTMKRLQRGLLADDLPECLIRTRTAVVLPSGRMTQASLDFIDRNYISVCKFSVLGQPLKRDGEGGIRFHIAIPGQYSVVAPDGVIPATLDGLPMSHSRWIEAGDHTLSVESPQTEKIALVWTRAADLGFSPFHKPPVFWK